MTIAIRPMNASIAPAKMTMTWPRERRRRAAVVLAGGTRTPPRPSGSGMGSSMASWTRARREGSAWDYSE